MRLTRRQTLAGGLAAVAGCGPRKGDSGDTHAGEPGSVDVVVVLMMENRSFDHFLGSLKLLEGHASDGLVAGMSNPDAAGDLHEIHPVQIDCLDDPPHGWSSSHAQFSGGANDGFVREYEEGRPADPGEVMSYQTRERLPVTYALADAYTVCDRYFCSVMGPTWPNRLYGHGGTSEGKTDNSLPDYGGAFTFPTIWKKLDEKGIPWKYYYTDVPFIGLMEGHVRDETVAFLEDFVRDAEKGELPPVVWIDPGFTFNDDHPPHHPGLGQELIAVIYEALAASPQWKRCLFLITYDEHGGFFDHVPPPTTDDDRVEDGFDQLGFRVPSIVVGPWVKPGVDGTTFDHTSWIKYVCERHGIEPWTKRIAAANSLGVVLDGDRMATGDALAAAEVPTFDMDDEALPDECFGGGASAMKQPHANLRKFVAERMPERDRSREIARFLGWVREQRRRR
ncbi:MAG: alkaline phosphatase family protein [Myxococcota bacterium]